jgi:integrase
MATIAKQKNGTKLIQVRKPNGDRATIRLGKVSMRDAEKIKTKIEELSNAKINGTTLDLETVTWLADRPDKLYDKLVKAGLANVRLVEDKVSTNLETFIDDYVTKRTDVKPATKTVWRQGKRKMLKFFGQGTMLEDVTAGRAADFKSKLLADGFAAYTISKHLQFANKIFSAAVDHELIAKNPFAKVKIKRTMPDRKFFVTPEATAKLLDAASNQDWRSIIALSRWAGLRSPSEVLSIKWADIDWDGSKMKVTSPKTAHHAGKEFRMVPLFPELRAELERAREAAAAGAVYVVDEKYRQSAMGPDGWKNCNLRTTFLKVVQRAGLKAWPRLFHNLRSSRQTELTEQFPAHVVCQWLGNSEKVAARHYLQTTDEHFARAVSGNGKALSKALPSRDTSHSTAAHAVANDVDFPDDSQNSLDSKNKKWRRRESNPRPAIFQ